MKTSQKTQAINELVVLVPLVAKETIYALGASAVLLVLVPT